MRMIIDIFAKIENSIRFGKTEDKALRKLFLVVLSNILQKIQINCTCFFWGDCQQLETLNLQSFNPHSLAKK